MVEPFDERLAAGSSAVEEDPYQEARHEEALPTDLDTNASFFDKTAKIETS